MKKGKEFIYYRESFLQSIFSDIVTFSFIIGGFLLNYFVMGNRWYIDLFFIILFWISLGAKGKAKTFHSKEELKKYLEETEAHDAQA